jgi:hypothetical protein
MKEFIKYYYDIYPKNIFNFNNNMIFSHEGNNYLIYPITIVSNLEKIIYSLNTTGILYHLIILNKNKEFFSEYQNEKFALLKIRMHYDNIINLSAFPVIKNEQTSDWGTIWKEKIDYYEEQLNEIIPNNSLKIYMQYYLGLCENAIYLNNKIKELFTEAMDIYTLCHYYVRFPNFAVDYLNPFNFKIDYQIRDIAEYIKSVFFNSEILDFNEIEKNIEEANLNDKMANLLIVRLIYPNYYFNEFDECINSKNYEISSKMFEIIKKSKEYEIFLTKVIQKISIKNKIIANDIWFFKYQH